MAPKGEIWSMQHEELDRREDDRVCAEAAGRNAKPGMLHGKVVFASAEEQSQRSVELLGAGALVVTLPPPAHHERGSLGERLEELVERALARLGAPSPYLAAWSAMPEDARGRLADQLFRARSVGATGLAIALGSLRAIAAPSLTPDDSATLRWLAETTEEAPLVLLVDDADTMLLGYAAPLPLGSLLANRKPIWEITPTCGIDVTTGRVASFEDDDMTTNDTHVVTVDVREDTTTIAAEPEVPPVSSAGIEQTNAAPAVQPLPAEPPSVHQGAMAPAVTASVPPRVPSPRPRGASREARPAQRASAGVPVSGPNDGWRSWAIALSSTRGAQPLAALERLFAEHYVPLANAIARGLDDPRAVRAYDEFRRSFERSYTDAFTTFGATNRRPRLVMDAYDVASKQARLSNARTSHVLVVDSMRFDLGCLVRDALLREATGIASLTSEGLLWSALPTTTMRQIETFARGLDALRAPAREEPAESLRGRAAEVVRRFRVGSRELYKLDLVPSMLEGAADVIASFEGIAAATAMAIARHVSTLPPRTLLFVVGDHGFTMDRRGQIQTGGASPEEVLVPGFSWLIGDLH